MFRFVIYSLPEHSKLLPMTRAATKSFAQKHWRLPQCFTPPCVLFLCISVEGKKNGFFRQPSKSHAKNPHWLKLTSNLCNKWFWEIWLHYFPWQCSAVEHLGVCCTHLALPTKNQGHLIKYISCSNHKLDTHQNMSLMVQWLKVQVLGMNPPLYTYMSLGKLSP